MLTKVHIKILSMKYHHFYDYITSGIKDIHNLHVV